LIFWVVVRLGRQVPLWRAAGVERWFVIASFGTLTRLARVDVPQLAIMAA
jgi:hypothetical protein